MFKKLKYKFDKYIVKIVSEIIEERVGKKVVRNRNFYDLWSESINRIFLDQYSDSEEEKSTGIYARMERLEEHLSSLEKHLGVEFYKDKKEVSGFKSIKKSKKSK